jgi:ABC-type sugar transport system ATPase subunit
VSFELRHGELLGIAGLVGAGRTELLAGLYGRLPHGGQITVEGRRLQARNASAAGIALLTEDRKREGLLFNLPVRANVTIGNLSLFAVNGVIQPLAERATALRKLTELRVKNPSLESSVAYLSGGNQQKVLLARILLHRPKVLLLDEPTKGVDVATRREINRLIVKLAGNGLGVIVVSSELEEVLGLSDRVLVMAEGRFVDKFHRGEGDEARIMHAVAAAQQRRVSLH